MDTAAVRYVTDEQGNRVSVVLDITDYEELRQLAEDYLDLIALREAMHETAPADMVDGDELGRRLGFRN